MAFCDICQSLGEGSDGVPVAVNALEVVMRAWCGAQPDVQGRAVQVGPITPMLKAPGTKRFKLKYEKLLSILLQFCFQHQLAPLDQGAFDIKLTTSALAVLLQTANPALGAVVGKCSLTLSNPR